MSPRGRRADAPPPAVAAAPRPLRDRLPATHGDRALVLPHEAPAARRQRVRLERHWRWARRDGVGRLIEEDQLDPRQRLATTLAKRAWRRRSEVAPGTARPVFVVGVQRSGTNMVVRGLEAAPEVEVHNENDRRAFSRFELRADDVVRDLVVASRHTHVLFKPLCDSHRVDELLDGLGTPTPPLAVWPYRGVDGRVRSAVAKFGDVNLRVVADIAAGRHPQRWQAQRIPAERVEALRSMPWASLTAEDGAALFWWARNGLYFDLGLDRRPDVALVAYEDVVADPAAAMERLCRFLGFPSRPELASHVDRRAAGPAQPLDLHPQVRALCDELAAQLRGAGRPGADAGAIDGPRAG